MRIAFRMDFSARIGGGHLMRCLTLANLLKHRGAECCFITGATTTALIEKINDQGHKVVALHERDDSEAPVVRIPNAPGYEAWLPVHWSVDAQATQSALRGEGDFDWLIVDHYALDANWESAVRSQVKQLMVIDDLANRPHDCDLLLDQNYHADPTSRYAGRVPQHCDLLLGPRYALLRPEFHAMHNRRQKRQRVSSILIFFGSVDITDESRRVLRIFAAHTEWDVDIDVVTGSLNPNLTSLQSECAAMSRCSLHVDTPDMARLVAAADLAIGAGGSHSWERACVGVPSIVIATAANQIEVAESLACTGAHLYLGPSGSVTETHLRSAIELFFLTPTLLDFFSTQSMSLCDGAGAERVSARLLQSSVMVRPATAQDCDMIYAWRNAEETRRYSFDPAPISMLDHRKWFAQVIGNPDRSLLIGECCGRACGVIRYDFDHDIAVVSIYLDPQQIGTGLGTGLLRSGTDYVARKYPKIRKIHAHIQADNRRSALSFEKAGFTPERSTFSLDLSLSTNSISTQGFP